MSNKIVTYSGFGGSAFGGRRGKKRRSSRRGKRKTPQQARFTRAAKQCKGDPHFKSCMRTELKGR